MRHNRRIRARSYIVLAEWKDVDLMKSLIRAGSWLVVALAAAWALFAMGVFGFLGRPFPWPESGGSARHELVATAQDYLYAYGPLVIAVILAVWIGCRPRST